MTKRTRDFGGLRVAAFESRRAPELQQMLERAGAVASVSPSMREVPLLANLEVVDFGRRLIEREFDLVILMTGVGFRLMLQALEGQVERGAFLEALAAVTTVARGPKPVAAMKEAGLQPSYRAPEPNTWRELLAVIEGHVPLAGRRVAVQEYGLPNLELVAGLERGGATVTTVPVYRWDLPLDTAPLASNLQAIADGGADVALFTSSQQVVHVLGLARRLGIEQEVRLALSRMVIASIGPTTSETLREQGLAVDVEPEHPKMGHLVNEAAAAALDLVGRKSRIVAAHGAPDSGRFAS